MGGDFSEGEVVEITVACESCREWYYRCRGRVMAAFTGRAVVSLDRPACEHGRIAYSTPNGKITLVSAVDLLAELA